MVLKKSSDLLYQKQLLFSNSNNIARHFAIRKVLGMESVIKKQSLICNDLTFLLCESCYWCASLLDTEKRIGLCPMCKSTSFVRMLVL
jgi:hypothetical protein